MDWFHNLKNKLLGRDNQYSVVNNNEEDVEAGPNSQNKKGPQQKTPQQKREDLSHLDLKKTTWAGALKITKSLLPYFWPRDNNTLKLRVLLCVSLIIVARIINVYVPMLYKNAVDDLPERYPFWTIFWYGMLTLIQKSLSDIRDTLFQNVSQEATRKISLQTFSHIHRLSLSFHLAKKNWNVIEGCGERDWERDYSSYSHPLQHRSHYH